MDRDRSHFLLLNVGHYLDHLFTLIFATVAALALTRDWGLGYGELLKYATPGFFAFGLFALPAGWLADKWSRDGMMVVFFVGGGLSAIGASFAQTPLQLAAGLFLIGVFASIYHPVGLAIVTQRWKNTGMRLAMNGVWGNLGVASAALVTGYFIDHGGWRIAFVVPGVLSIGVGAIYALHQRADIALQRRETVGSAAATPALTAEHKALLLRLSAIVFTTTAVSSVIFQSTTFALPKIFDERLQGVAQNLSAWMSGHGLAAQGDLATVIGGFTFLVFAAASASQLLVGRMLDRVGPRPVFLAVTAIQFVFFFAMPGMYDGWALAVALGFMLGAFGQIPISDFMIGKMAAGPQRARVYGVRYVVSFTGLAITLPLVAYIYENYGFDMLFKLMAVLAAVIFAAASRLPARLPTSPTAEPAGA